MISLQKACVEFENKLLLDKLNIDFEIGTSSLILGPNGSGKSTLAKTLLGYPGYDLVSGKMTIEQSKFYGFIDSNLKVDLSLLTLSQRAKMGIFLSFQNPVDLVGIAPVTFLKTIFNNHQNYIGKTELNSAEFLVYLKDLINEFALNFNLLDRKSLEGLSGGEKKNFELLQLLLLQPKFMILDEIDSGLDIDSIRKITKIINSLRTSDTCLMVISHNPSFVEYLHFDNVRVLIRGKLVDSGNTDLAKEIKNNGYMSYA